MGTGAWKVRPREMYLHTGQVEYAPRKNRSKWQKVRRCLDTHKAGCECWKGEK